MRKEKKKRVHRDPNAVDRWPSVYESAESMMNLSIYTGGHEYGKPGGAME